MDLGCFRLSFFYFQIAQCIINFMISQEISLQTPAKPLLKPLNDELPFDQDEFRLEQELSGMTLDDSPSNQLNQDFQFKLTEDQTAEEPIPDYPALQSFKRSHRATQDLNVRCRPMLAKLQRLQRIPIKKRHF